MQSPRENLQDPLGFVYFLTTSRENEQMLGISCHIHLYPIISLLHIMFLFHYVPLYTSIYIYTFLIIVVYPFRQSQRSAGQEISRLQQQNSVQQQNQGRSSDELVFTILPTKNKYGGFHSHGVYNSEMISYHTNIGYIYNDWYKSPILARI